MGTSLDTIVSEKKKTPSPVARKSGHFFAMLFMELLVEYQFQG
jgi:hypothetical protein